MTSILHTHAVRVYHSTQVIPYQGSQTQRVERRTVGVPIMAFPYLSPFLTGKKTEAIFQAE